MDEKGLLKLKEQIDQAKTKVAEYQGKHSYMMGELEKQFGCKTLDSAREKLTEMETEIENLDLQIKDGLAKLEKLTNA